MKPPQLPGLITFSIIKDQYLGNDAHQRVIPFYSCPHPVFTFGFGGKVVSIKAVPNPNGSGNQNIQFNCSSNNSNLPKPTQQTYIYSIHTNGARTFTKTITKTTSDSNNDITPQQQQ